jgi:hypothetical protein
MDVLAHGLTLFAAASWLAFAAFLLCERTGRRIPRIAECSA